MMRIVAALLVAGVPALALAEGLTREECIDRALKNSPRLKLYQMDRVAAGEEVKIARTGFYPFLKLRGRYSLADRPDRLIITRDTFGTGTPPQDVEISTGSTSSYDVTLTVTQPLYTGGALANAYRRSRLQSEEASLVFSRQQKELVRDVRLSFNRLLNDRLYSEILGKISQAKLERLRVLRELEREGYVGREEILQQEADVALGEAERYRAANSEELEARRLKNLIGAESAEPLPLQGEPLDGVFALPLEQARELAVKNREDAKAASARVERAEAEVGIARSALYPQLSLQGNYLLQKETAIARPRVLWVTAQLEWSLFEWGRTEAEVRKKSALRQRSQYEREELARELLLEVDADWRGLKEQEQTVGARQKKAAAAEYLMKLKVERYGEGKAKLVDVIEAEAAFVREYKEYVMALNDLGSALARLEATLSTPVGSWLAPRPGYRPEIDPVHRRLELLKEQKRRERSEAGGAPAALLPSEPAAPPTAGGRAQAPEKGAAPVADTDLDLLEALAQAQ